jgi:hypothetical protein
VISAALDGEAIASTYPPKMLPSNACVCAPSVTTTPGGRRT